MKNNKNKNKNKNKSQFNEETMIDDIGKIAAANHSQEKLAKLFGISLRTINAKFKINTRKISYERALCLKDMSIRKKIHEKAMSGDLKTLMYLAITRLNM